ncbi:MAG: aminoacyl-tRNA hydrolase [Hyphomicrobiales bacterium]|uniref:aminoacyl-tRNA hydrolase n=1 Tax=Rhabdaerophilum calidifontis TaxID=2604328 RepID=UPI00123B763D|nr:aminoacyl-tRNA hydrolase [Rhabdaerophilum calidifontis]MCA1951696.1 aminoacyl-tRNA hydrolase [Hyphomicrobiales bacterium]MCA1999916.1 aminoacyl-tRNA hydrolase [Hyphomicrobiales bacterium]
MHLLVGLGNPGQRYAGNRHNIGFMALDAIHRQWRGTPWRARFQGQTAEAVIGGAKTILLKPETYMNESGRAVGEAMRFFKIPLAGVIVFHDELDLPPAKLRLKTGGGNAGHNGLRSISQHCGNDYPRVRLGIGHPGDKAQVQAYVLNDFARSEAPWVEDLCAAIAAHADLLLAEPGHFQSKVHLLMEARGHGAAEPVPKAAKKAGQEPDRG